MLYSKVFLKLHWGFYVSYPQASKAKPSFYLPPPTTLVGALSYGKFRGTDTKLFKGKPGSPAGEFKVKAAATFAKEFAGSYSEDIVRNVIMYFQRKERRMDPRYRYNVVPTGKVYAPNQVVKVVYVTDMGKEELERLSWSITRLGCKECLVSVEDVEVGEAKAVKGRVKTPYYFPASVKVVSGRVENVDFWEGRYGWGSSGNTVMYSVPVVGYPLRTREVEVEAEEAYEVGGEYVVFG
ncbi:type I-A CRISPR-associated protein Cas5a [Stygiolobus caldivivus]|uniref:Type I-A CRISPR-associated protein Cas5 n=1 Tax=Stygiolobus caldivivus TaxID=2824673 RepID=A0A8D5U5Q9_9CREN|nr:type I-A CRISPR-associated protein Cas5a [Stygiolobus caldivivus]BCU69799.1 type I-A CRISPR-associated protein Cas5 [Stygiolobus caldivivus]